MPQELIDEYTKNSSRFPNFDTIVATTVLAVDEYNDKLKPKFKQSPNERYEKSEQPKCFEVDVFKRMQLFTRKTEQKITNGQFTIKRGEYEYSYQLPAEFSARYNGETVTLRYADFGTMYLYDYATDAPICSVLQKSDIHGAMGDQTDSDVHKLHKNTGRLKGIESKSRKRKNTIFDQCDTINPNAADAINKVKAPKEVVKQIEQNLHLREIALNQGVKPERVTDAPALGMLTVSAPERKENNHPFSPKHETKIEKITIEDWKQKMPSAVSKGI